MHTDSIKECPAVRRRCVQITRRAGLTNDVALNGGEGLLHVEIGATLEIVNSSVHALPSHGYAGNVFGGWCEFQHGSDVGWICACNPLLPVVHAVAVRVGEIRRAICGQSAASSAIIHS